ncbi:hypothetical protein [Actinomadura sp. 6K520]|uniref:hypothetical protein n=1 Tax=Actinomadura sp. 6K520 TaxID=2530364 RepID=UPI001046895D|nr:hypothetical protein [Actinomadura sp. 6K520]TDE26736.1 hypothetical protein E1289_24630 [Actinomadura sp. 6K520]
MTTYSLTVINESELMQGSPTFAVVAELPEARTSSALSTAWLTQVIHPGNRYTFSWEIEWGFAWSANGTVKDYQWVANGALPADPASSARCAATFDYMSGDFLLKPATQTPAPNNDRLWIEDTSAIPRPSVQPSSVGVTLNGQPACVADAGPNLEHVFTLHPTYYIVAGSFQQCQMVDVATLTQTQELEYDDGVAALTVVLDGANTWQVAHGALGDPARPLRS